MPKISHVHQVLIGCDDLDSSIAFYRDVLGCDFVARVDPPGLGFFKDPAGNTVAIATRRTNSSKGESS